MLVQEGHAKRCFPFSRGCALLIFVHLIEHLHISISQSCPSRTHQNDIALPLKTRLRLQYRIFIGSCVISCARFTHMIADLT
ncbi:hypothetical protein BDN70DRAFT_286769 [Pholiota conissans]|uniref:Secreted protein n=1 Tax=Pholiota conissans TaxID=109636 RepID=A0A9P6CPQ6_9AGAR|nr:hypothetical protein BDN70DRAFT_286769 [Pholiota conissans]